MRLSLSKLGSHVDRRSASGYAYTRSIFSNEDIGIAAGSSAAGAAVVLGHWKMPWEDDIFRAGLMHRDPQDMAREYWEVTAPFLELVRAEGGDLHNVYAVGANEPVFNNDEIGLAADKMFRYSLFETFRMQLAEERGYRCAIGSFATGTPEIQNEGDLWPFFYGALEQCHNGQHLLALHEYWGCSPDLFYGQSQIEDGVYVPGSLFTTDYDEGWLALRLRKIWRLHISPNNWTGVRIVLTECGADYVGVNHEVQAWAGGVERGWKDWVRVGIWRNKWHNEARQFLINHANGSTITPGAAVWLRDLITDNLSDEMLYFATLIWYDEQIRKDHYVVGCQIFTHGSFGWSNFLIDGIVADLVYTYLEKMLPV